MHRLSLLFNNLERPLLRVYVYATDALLWGGKNRRIINIGALTTRPVRDQVKCKLRLQTTQK